jgi:hypothetical protein
VAAFEAAVSAKKAREKLIQLVADYWCEETGRDSVHRSTINTVASYVDEFGFKVVAGWIDRAIVKLGKCDDRNIGRYISGIRRSVLKPQSNGNGDV